MTEFICSIYQLTFAHIIIFSIFSILFILFILFIDWFLKPAYVNKYDPLRIKFLLFYAPALFGFLVFSLNTSYYKFSFWITVIFFFVYLLIIRIIGRPKKIKFEDCSDKHFQFVILWSELIVILLHFYVNMYSTSNIPLFQEYGVYNRFSATLNNRILSWLYFSFSGFSMVIFAVSRYSKVKKFALLVFFVEFIIGILFASKGAILKVLYLILYSMFIFKIRRMEIEFRRSKKLLIIVMLLLIITIPFYFWAIGLHKNVLFLLLLRFFGGYDQLIPAVYFDVIPKDLFSSIFSFSLLQYQLMPFFKLFGIHFDYNSIGQYIVELWTGRLIEGAFTFPNSNLILECIFTEGVLIGFLVFVTELILFYYIRFYLLSSNINNLKLVMVKMIIFQPCALFQSGQEFFVKLTLTVAILSILLFVFEISVKPSVLKTFNYATGK